jgi:hypothetical protein
MFLPASCSSIASQVVNGTLVSLREAIGRTGASRATRRTGQTRRSSPMIASLDQRRQAPDKGLAVAGHRQQRLVVIAERRHLETVDVDDLDHATTRGDGNERAWFVRRSAEREPVGAGMLVAGIHGLDPDADPGLPEGVRRVGQALIGRVPAHQAAEQAHVGALARVRGGQRAVAIELDQDFPEVRIHQVAGQPADAQGRRAVRTRRPAHDGTDHVIEDADDHAATVASEQWRVKNPHGRIDGGSCPSQAPGHPRRP